MCRVTLPDLGVQILHDVLDVETLLRARLEQCLDTAEQLLLPSANLIGVNPIRTAQLRDRDLVTNSLQRHLRLERRTVIPTRLPHHDSIPGAYPAPHLSPLSRNRGPRLNASRNERPSWPESPRLSAASHQGDRCVRSSPNKMPGRVVLAALHSRTYSAMAASALNRWTTRFRAAVRMLACWSGFSRASVT